MELWDRIDDEIFAMNELLNRLAIKIWWCGELDYTGKHLNFLLVC